MVEYVDWKLLLYWVIHRNVPSEAIRNHDILAIRCWELGERHDIPEFQDEAMLSLLASVARNSFKAAIIREGLSRSTKGTILRTLMLDEAIRFCWDNHGTDTSVFNEFDGLDCVDELVVGFYEWDARILAHQRQDRMYTNECEEEGTIRWKAFMKSAGARTMRYFDEDGLRLWQFEVARGRKLEPHWTFQKLRLNTEIEPMLGGRRRKRKSDVLSDDDGEDELSGLDADWERPAEVRRR